MRVGRGRPGPCGTCPDAEPPGRARGARDAGRPREGAEAVLSASSCEVFARSSDAVRRSEASSRASPKPVIPPSGLPLSPITPPADVLLRGVRDMIECGWSSNAPRLLDLSRALYCIKETKNNQTSIAFPNQIIFYQLWKSLYADPIH